MATLDLDEVVLPSSQNERPPSELEEEAWGSLHSQRALLPSVSKWGYFSNSFFVEVAVCFDFFFVDRFFPSADKIRNRV